MTRPAAPVGPHPVELAGLLHELTARLLSADTFTQALERLAAFAAGAVPGAVRASIVLIGEGGPLTHSGHGAPGAAVDAIQYAAGTTGPGLESARTRAMVTAPDLATDARWPELAEAARTEGIHAVAAIPLDLPRAEVGALSLYFDTAEAPGADHLLTAMAVANQSEILLDELRRREAQNAGAAVDRAIGVIIAQRGCGVQEAYDILRDTAQRLGLDRHAVADRLIAVAARNA
ncbi:GAF and ANTAR domain-containing protein [Actinoplanes sp. Pm04-4]|uniref:GAF and ANTAR domain-containing protein n=1 Tax=Paractinoplanes pyxinae TaxID=2997416 RepID=A0ABT4BDP9_9ACTN|nr:GAF and ANTAR domain-containing protein [Actinoplanes pyxinae]MCY1144650.1 GAF and ANTAR domain-containing protein [Actinoplanes pyxinae]